MSSMFCTKIYKCKNVDWCARDFNPKSDEPKCFEPQTNADRIRAMSDEELAEWMAKIMYCAECMFFNEDNGTCNYEHRHGKGCNGAMLDWLKQEAEE